MVWDGFCKRVLPEVESKVYRQAMLENVLQANPPVQFTLDGEL